MDDLLRGLLPHGAVSVLHRINTYLLRWIMNKYKKLRTWKKAIQSMSNAAASQPRYFAHWAWAKPATR